MPDASRFDADAPGAVPGDPAASLRAAGVATHVAEAPAARTDAAEAELLGRLCGHVPGPVFRLGRGRYACRLDGAPEAAAEALAAAVDLGPGGRCAAIPAAPAPGPDAALTLVAPLALGAGAARVVIDAEFALETARRTGDAIAAAAEAASARDGGASETARRLDAIDAALDALREGREADAGRLAEAASAAQAEFAAIRAALAAPDDRLDRVLAALEARDRRLERLEARLAALPDESAAAALDALRETVEDGRAETARRETALTDRLDPLADRLRAAEARLSVVTETLGAVASELSRAPDVRRERDGLLMFAANLQSLLAGIDAQADRLRRIADGAAPLAELALDRAAAEAAAERLGGHVEALAELRTGFDEALGRLEAAGSPPDARAGAGARERAGDAAAS